MADKIDFASMSYLLGILSIVFAFVSPVAGLILGIIGLNQGKRHGGDKAKKLNTIGIILSIIFIVVSLIAVYYSVTSNGGLGDFFPTI